MLVATSARSMECDQANPLLGLHRRTLELMLGMDMSYQTLGSSELRMVLGWIGYTGQARCVVVIRFSHAWPSAGEPGRQSGRGPIWKHPARSILRGKAVHVERFNTTGPAGSEILAAP
jgi:hypothetical protein